MRTVVLKAGHTNPKKSMKTAQGFAAFTAVIVASIALSAQELYVRVVDVGAGECVVIKAPGKDEREHYIIYDAGNWEDAGKTAKTAIAEIVKPKAEIDLLVLSHSDGDHVAAAPYITKNFEVLQSIHPGNVRPGQKPTAYWPKARDALRLEATGRKKEWNLAQRPLVPGTALAIGEAQVTLICGFSEPPEDFDLKPGDKSEFMNAGSIVIRITYAGKSLLICGDAVGRHLDSDPRTCIATERFMVQNAATVTIDSDVIVAPHHGADNGSSEQFIEAVSPEYVIFSAGHEYEHPRAKTVARYTAAGIQEQNIFRTDRGDDEGSREWNYLRKKNTVDGTGDDDVEIRISASGAINVGYRKNALK